MRLSYLPLVAVAPNTSPLISVQARYSRPRRGEMIDPAYEQIAWVFGFAGCLGHLQYRRCRFSAEYQANYVSSGTSWACLTTRWMLSTPLVWPRSRIRCKWPVHRSSKMRRQRRDST